MATTQNKRFQVTRTIGQKRYEFCDHLSNVRNVITDTRKSDRTGTSNPNFVFHRFATEDVGLYNMYAYGMPKTEPNDYINANGFAYRYGFNGQEKDNEVKGVGNSLDFGARVYDSRLGRFLSGDIYTNVFSFQSSYCFAGNSPIKFIDMEGKFKVSPSIKKYPMVYKYLCTQLEKDILNSKDIPRVYIMLFKVDIEILKDKEIKFGEGAEIQDWRCPENGEISACEGAGAFNAKTENIEINTLLFEFCENALSNGSGLNKKIALTFLYMQILHEEGHRIAFKYGKKEPPRINNKFIHVEDGSDVEYYLYRDRISRIRTDLNKSLKDCPFQSN
jgi:RHS repeat-associated protein